jgi:hypothetical protein
MEETNIKEAVEEIRGASEDELQKVIEQWFESTRTQGLKIGAKFISAAIFGVIEKHIKKKTGAKASLRDYQRMTDEIMKIISVQLKTEPNDSEEDVTEENENDRTTESNDNTNS